MWDVVSPDYLKNTEKVSCWKINKGPQCFCLMLTKKNDAVKKSYVSLKEPA